MRKVIITLLILFIFTLAAVISGKNEMRKASETVADGAVITAELNTLSTIETAETEPVTTTVQETTTEIVTETTTETTTTTTTEKSSKTEKRQYLGRWYITGYTAEEGFGYGSTTTSGVGCRPGICAMNNAQREALGIEWGDSVYVEGHGVYRVQDSTADYVYNTIDIWCYTNKEAYALTGYYDVYICEEEK